MLLGTLADYVSMVSLAQIDAEADLTGHSTVMNLFNAPGQVKGLSQWDKDYLVALYSTPPDRFDPRRQQAVVMRSLIRQRQKTEGVNSWFEGAQVEDDSR